MKNLDIKKVPKGWGYELWLCNSPDYCGKILHFKKGKKCSFHFHKRKNEHFHCLEGSFKIIYSFEDSIENSSSIALNKGDTFFVPRGLRHQMIASNNYDYSELVEFSTEHFDEDSYRINKGD